MAGKNSRFNKILQTIGIVDDVEEEFGDNRGDYYGGRDSDYRSSNQRDYGRNDSSYGFGNSNYGNQGFSGGNARDFEDDGFSSRYNQPRSQQGYRSQQSQPRQGNYSQRGNVTPMPQRGNYQQESGFSSRSNSRSDFDGRQNNRAAQGEFKPHTAIYAIRTLEECRDVIVDLIEGKTTVVNLEDLRSDLQQRAIDTLSGASFALNAVLRKASDKIYLIAPVGVQVDDMGAVERRR